MHARTLIVSGADQVYVSAASVWEISIKRRLLPEQMPIFGAQAKTRFSAAGLKLLAISAEHAAQVIGQPGAGLYFIDGQMRAARKTLSGGAGGSCVQRKGKKISIEHCGLPGCRRAAADYYKVRESAAQTTTALKIFLKLSLTPLSAIFAYTAPVYTTGHYRAKKHNAYC